MGSGSGKSGAPSEAVGAADAEGCADLGNKQLGEARQGVGRLLKHHMAHAVRELLHSRPDDSRHAVALSVICELREWLQCEYQVMWSWSLANSYAL